MWIYFVWENLAFNFWSSRDSGFWNVVPRIASGSSAPAMGPGFETKKRPPGGVDGWGKSFWKVKRCVQLGPGSSKWPRLDPQGTFSGRKWPPFRESNGHFEEAGRFKRIPLNHFEPLGVAIFVGIVKWSQYESMHLFNPNSGLAVLLANKFLVPVL